MTQTSGHPRFRLSVSSIGAVFGFILFSIALTTAARAATITAASPSLADVRAAIAAAASGDTVLVPAGSATWTGQLLITKGVKLIGAGIGSTIITSGYTAPGLYDALVNYQPANPSANEPFRFSGFTVDLANKCVGIALANHASTPVDKVRVDHVRLLNSSNRTIMILGAVYGVIDSCAIESVSTFPITCFADNESTWSNFTFDFGTSKNMYVEDCTFTLNDSALEGGLGGRYCVRYNTFNFDHPTQGLAPWFDMHGNQGNLATMGAEVYENVVNAGTHNVAIADVRGGKALVYNNRANTSANVSLNVREEFLDSTNPPAANPAGQPQHVSDTFFWNNTKNGSSVIGAWVAQTVDYGGSIGAVPKENRDFWNQSAPFNGTSGLGAGLLSARPATCAAGVAYWATDTKTLYKATAANTWTAYYTPYPYPHPLRSETSIATLTTTSPNGGENWVAGSSSNIAWTTTGTVGNVKIEYSTNGGTSYSAIVASTTNSGSYAWTVPNAPSTACLIRISEAAAGTPADVSNAAFTISAPAPQATIAVTSPNGGENWVAGTAHAVTWTTTGTVGNVKIEFSTNGGTSYSTVVASATNSGSYAWTVPNTISANCLVRVSQASTGTPTDAGNAVFAISGAPTIAVTSPNGGESWIAGSSHAITWTTSGTVGNVKIEYSTNGGTSYSTIIASTTNNGSYAWTVPNSPSSTCLVRVSEASTGTPTDAGNAVFAISGAPTIAVTSPNGGENWIVGSSHAITWTTSGTVGNVKIEFSTNGGTSYSTIIASTTNNGSYAWTVPNSPSSTCLVRVSEASTGTPTDAGNAVFAISGASTIAVTSPNGGENWIVGSSHAITWTTSGTVGNVKIEFSTNGGTSYSTIIASTTNNGSYAWTVPNAISANCLVRISQASTGTPTDTGNAVFAIASSATASISLSRNNLKFGASTGGTKTPDQSVLIGNSGQGTLSWTAEGSGSPYFLQISQTQGLGSGIIQIGINATGLLKGTYTGYVKVYASGATNSPQTITVKLRVYDQGTTTSPFGMIDTPGDGSTVMSAVPVTGWVLDDIGVDSVKIYREPLAGEQGGANGLAYVGDAIFVDGARNDIAGAYPEYPLYDRAGWGYMMLTNMLPPSRGNGDYRIHAVALDKDGNEVDLGTKTIHCDNAHAVKPFGALDTPSQGGVASGTNFKNFGWALTPTPNAIPVDGSTITVWVDGEAVGHTLYGTYRADVAAMFPGYANSAISSGVFDLDTTLYANGVHTIAWGVTDSSGNADGIGSRFFNILNTGAAASQITGLAATPSIETVLTQPVAFQPVPVRRGLKTAARGEFLSPDASGTIRVEIRETERIEIELGNSGRLKGGLVAGADLTALPVGSRLNADKGTFSWMPAPGFLGEYDFLFLKEDAAGRMTRIPVQVFIKPKFDRD